MKFVGFVIQDVFEGMKNIRQTITTLVQIGAAFCAKIIPVIQTVSFREILDITITQKS